ncbi:unnamed protein product [Tilletia controversa]|uniref:Uncharacterized protein n=3 Tax=Tilletia TaxID=13289 RepID=A0A8X7SZX2_9BASI|nr:hypothetical protein CF336_g5342 [Tilletia laevis]KAE8193930.1 hypothetical protein CF328_g4898 [Tilletia controversa]KAE8255399.1 hypothetical protein A4X03_0g5572 [Tilletia caries]KAE8197179.1 hypothetical protein CF335_g4680 [Tilletia laevis]KAE8254047.1 hypothetical protein A4X06_0g1086 [Tilletia controversa]
MAHLEVVPVADGGRDASEHHHARSPSHDPLDIIATTSPPPQAARLAVVLMPLVNAPAIPRTSSPMNIDSRPVFPDTLHLRPGQHSGSGSGSGSGSSSGSSSASSILSGGRLGLQSRQSSPATSRSNSAQDPLEHADRHASPTAYTAASAKVLGKRKADELLLRPPGPQPTKSPHPLNRIHERNDTIDYESLVSTVPPLGEPIFPITLYNSAYRFFPACSPSTSTLHHSAHPPAETQCPWVVQEGAWGKEAVRCGREFTSPDMLARHVLLTHCHIDGPGLAPSSATDLGTTATAAAKVPCRYASCSHRTFNSTEKMRAHVIQIHLLPAFLFLCPFENCRLPYNEQPDTQHKLEGHIDRIHDEEKEQLRPFARVGGMGPKGARFSLLRQIPAVILDKNKGGVQPGAAWWYMCRAAAVSGFDLETAGPSSAPVEPPSGVTRPAVGASLSRNPSFPSGPLEKSAEKEGSESNDYGATGLNSLEEESALKMNTIAKVSRISSTDVGGHWLHQPQARRPPLPKKLPRVSKSSKGSPVKPQGPNFVAIANAAREEIKSRREADAARAQKKLTPSQRSLVEPPVHPASSQTVVFKPTRVQPYVSLIAKMSYLQTPATPLLPSETMLSLAPPPTSAARAGEVYGQRHAQTKGDIMMGNLTVDADAGMLVSTLPKRQVLLDVFLDRPERTLAVEGVEFLKEGGGSFECVDIPRREGISLRAFGIGVPEVVMVEDTIVVQQIDEDAEGTVPQGEEQQEKAAPEATSGEDVDMAQADEGGDEVIEARQKEEEDEVEPEAARAADLDMAEQNEEVVEVHVEGEKEGEEQEEEELEAMAAGDPDMAEQNEEAVEVHAEEEEPEATKVADLHMAEQNDEVVEAHGEEEEEEEEEPEATRGKIPLSYYMVEDDKEDEEEEDVELWYRLPGP